MTSAFKPVLFLALLFVSAGCTTPGMFRQSVLDSLSPVEMAYVAGKYTVDCKVDKRKQTCETPFNLISTLYKDSGEPAFMYRVEVRRSWSGSNTPIDETDLEAGTASIYFCHPVAPGSYRFYDQWYYDFAGGGDGYHLSQKKYFDIPFSAQAGMISVVDRIHVSVGYAKSLLGVSYAIPGGLEFSALDDSEIELALAKCPESAKSFTRLQQTVRDTESFYPFPEWNDGTQSQ